MRHCALCIPLALYNEYLEAQARGFAFGIVALTWLFVVGIGMNLHLNIIPIYIIAHRHHSLLICFGQCWCWIVPKLQ